VEELLRKLFLTALVVLMDPGSPLQVTLAVLVSGWAHVLHAIYKPWRVSDKASENVTYMVQHGSLFVTTLVFLMGLLFKVEGVSSKSPTYEALSVVMLLVCIAFVLWWFYEMFSGVARTGCSRLRRSWLRVDSVVAHAGGRVAGTHMKPITLSAPLPVAAAMHGASDASVAAAQAAQAPPESESSLPPRSMAFFSTPIDTSAASDSAVALPAVSRRTRASVVQALVRGGRGSEVDGGLVPSLSVDGDISSHDGGHGAGAPAVSVAGGHDGEASDAMPKLAVTRPDDREGVEGKGSAAIASESSHVARSALLLPFRSANASGPGSRGRGSARHGAPTPSPTTAHPSGRSQWSGPEHATAGYATVTHDGAISISNPMYRRK
jgi:hypothetical protein